MTASEKARLAELLDRWEEAAERGEELDPAQLCADSPQLQAELMRQIAALKTIDGRLGLDGKTVPLTPKAPSRDPGAPAECMTQSSYSQLTFLAKGGLGIVYRALDSQLNREVVLKFIQRRMASSDEHRVTFRREAEVTSRLDHPGIVPVYGMGQDDEGRVFYVMRYVQGETLDEAIGRLYAGGTQPAPTSELELRNLLGRFITICKTIAYAHNRGIIHRDIKPANIMLGRFSETLIVDWGLATPVGRDERFKQSGEKTLMPSDGQHSTDSGAGTPAYMSPEAMSQSALTPATDIYSLGATLYKLLTGQAAFEAPGLIELRSLVIRGQFKPPSSLNREMSRALEAVCLKAMATDPLQRYTTALELATDIENYLADEPVSAYQEPIRRRAARWARRHRHAAQAILGGASVLAVFMVLSAVGLGYLANNEREARKVAEAAKQQSLRMAAKFAARTIAGQIDLRWRILEAAAKDASLKDTLLQINADPQDQQLWPAAQAWLNQEHLQLLNDQAIQFSSLFLLDQRGTQVARTPPGDSIGNSFAFRDYFHGLGHDLDPGEGGDAPGDQIQPIKDVNLSATYTSSTSQKLKVAFTVPIVGGNLAQRQVIGVLGMSVDLGEFGVLDTDLRSGQMVVLVDSRMDSIEGQPRRGLILQHPQLDQTGPSQSAARLGDEALRQLDAPNGTFLLQGYVDPLAAGRWTACFERVTVDGRQGTLANTGWIVLVQERIESE